jgi:hypothetical protein
MELAHIWRNYALSKLIDYQKRFLALQVTSCDKNWPPEDIIIPHGAGLKMR